MSQWGFNFRLFQLQRVLQNRHNNGTKLMENRRQINATRRAPPTYDLRNMRRLVFYRPLLAKRLMLGHGGMVYVNVTRHFRRQTTKRLRPVNYVFRVRPYRIIRRNLPRVAIPYVGSTTGRHIAMVFISRTRSHIRMGVNNTINVTNRGRQLGTVNSYDDPSLVNHAPLLHNMTLNIRRPGDLTTSDLTKVHTTVASQVEPYS